MDTKGLKNLLAFYDHRNALKRTLEEKKWLNTKASVPVFQTYSNGKVIGSSTNGKVIA